MSGKTYKIGKITLTQQAFTALILGIVMSLTTLVAFHKSKKGIAIALGYLIMTFYNTYMINCLVVGHCKELAWALVVLMSLTVLFIVGAFARSGFHI